MNLRLLALIAVVPIGVVACVAAAQPPPPPPPPPPAFMAMKGLPLSCFDKPNFEQDGLEFFVCNGGGGLAAVRKKNDPKHVVFVHDQDIVQNLNMQAARSECVNGRFSVSADQEGVISFRCGGSEVTVTKRFQTASKAEWTAWSKYLNR